MKWNVFYYDSNKREVTTFDIFKHGAFRKDVDMLLTSSSFEEFSEELRKILMYYFWSKCEYEIIISPWCGSRDTVSRKIDIYTQVMNNWDVFIEYIWRDGRKNH